MPIDNATGNIAVICKEIYAPVITKEVRLVLNNSTYPYRETNNTSTNEIIDCNLKDLESKLSRIRIK